MYFKFTSYVLVDAYEINKSKYKIVIVIIKPCLFGLGLTWLNCLSFKGIYSELFKYNMCSMVS